MATRPTMVVLGYPTRLVTDHAVLLESAAAAGIDARLVAPGRIAVCVDDAGERVVIDGEPCTPDVVLPRGMNRPWPFVRQALAVWDSQGVVIVPSLAAADLCADKLATTRALATAGVPVLPTLGVAPDTGVRLTALGDHVPLVSKPARASKGRGVETFASLDDAEYALGVTRPLRAGMVDHRVVQPLASEWGVDHRVVVATADDGSLRVVATTERRAPSGSVTTNAPGSTVVDIDHHDPSLPDVTHVALAATAALGLTFAGVDVIRHLGRAVVLEVNAWPGLAAEVRGRQLADALVTTARQQLEEAARRGVARAEPDR